MIINVPPELSLMFFNIVALFVFGVFYFCYARSEKKHLNKVIEANKSLMNSVVRLTDTINKAIEQNIIDQAIAEGSNNFGDPEIE